MSSVDDFGREIDALAQEARERYRERGQFDESKEVSNLQARAQKALDEICQLHDAFDSTRHLYGHGGVADHIGVSPNAVYLQLKTHDLTPDDMREFLLDDVIDHSPKIQNPYKELKEISHIVPTLDEIPDEGEEHW